MRSTGTHVATWNTHCISFTHVQAYELVEYAAVSKSDVMKEDQQDKETVMLKALRDQVMSR